MKVFCKIVVILGLLTTTVFAEELQNNQESYNKNVIYFNVGQSFGKGNVIRKDTYADGEIIDNLDLGRTKYTANFALGSNYFINKNFFIGIEILAPLVNTKNEEISMGYNITKPNGDISIYEESSSKHYNISLASFITAGYKLFEKDGFAISIHGGIGGAIHYLHLRKDAKTINIRPNFSSGGSGTSNTDAATVTFAYQVGITESLKLTDMISLNLGISYFNLGSPTFKGKAYTDFFKTDYKINNNGYANASLGLSFSL